MIGCLILVKSKRNVKVFQYGRIFKFTGKIDTLCSIIGVVDGFYTRMKMQEENGEICPSIVNIPQLIEMQKVQLLLSEQRTALSIFRTGIAIFTLPLSVLTVLIATSRYYKIMEILYLVIPTGIIIIGLTALAVWMIIRAMKNIVHIREMIDKVKEHDDFLKEFLRS
jgi:hypothetical protein